VWFSSLSFVTTFSVIFWNIDSLSVDALGVINDILQKILFASDIEAIDLFRSSFFIFSDN